MNNKIVVSDTFLRAIALGKNRQSFNARSHHLERSEDQAFARDLLALFQTIPHFVYGVQDFIFTGYVGKNNKIHINYHADKKSPDHAFTSACVQSLNDELSIARECGIDCRWDEQTQTYTLKDIDELFRVAIYLHDELKLVSPEAEEAFTSSACSIREAYRPHICDLDSLTRTESQMAILRGLKGILSQYKGAENFTITPLEINDSFFFVLGCNDDPSLPQPDNAETVLTNIYHDLHAMEAMAPFVSFEMWPCGNNLALGVDELEDIIPLLNKAYNELKIEPSTGFITPSEILSITRQEEYQIKAKKLSIN